jgi:hypothetical protein
MIAQPKHCPKCQKSMRLDERPRPTMPGAHFVNEDYWVCTNENCDRVFVAD